jgi:DNA-binding response OmpR family regulator
VAAKPTILVVEDDDDCRAVLQDLLELNGYAVKTCPNAHRAVDVALAAPPALMIIDYMMPDADGGWVIRSLRESSGPASRVPVVLTSGSEEGRLIAERLGVQSLEKPFDVNRLLELVQALVRKA